MLPVARGANVFASRWGSSESLMAMIGCRRVSAVFGANVSLLP